MSNITMSVDDELLKKARKIAVEKDTTLTGLIREYLEQLVEREEAGKEIAIAELKRLFAQKKAVFGARTWTREDLHERR
jgi:predicted transcriptional regulator